MSRATTNEVLRKPPFDSDRPIIEQMIDDGMSDSEIALHFNVAKDTIWCRRNRWGLTQSGSEIKEQKLKESLTQLWIEGYTVSDMASVLNLGEQAIYKKLRQYDIRSVSRMGIEAPNMSLTELRSSASRDEINEDQVIVVTRNREPRWALVPIDQYQDLVRGNFAELREQTL